MKERVCVNNFLLNIFILLPTLDINLKILKYLKKYNNTNFMKGNVLNTFLCTFDESSECTYIDHV